MKNARAKQAHDHPALNAARRAIRRTLAHLTPVQLMRLATTAEILAYGEERGHWSLSSEWAADRERAQPYQLGLDGSARKRGAR